MPSKPQCPQCGSTNVKDLQDNGIDYIQCLKCGYDELESDDEFPHQRSTQREKGRYSPYKTGGKTRGKK